MMALGGGGGGLCQHCEQVSVRGKLSFYWSSEHHSENDVTNEREKKLKSRRPDGPCDSIRL